MACSIQRVSSTSQAAPAYEPDQPGPALADQLLSQLDAPRSGPLAEFVRAYVRRVPAALLAEADIDELAAQVAGMFGFASRRTPGELAVRVFIADHARDGYTCPGAVVEVNVEDAPFLVDTVTAELKASDLQVRLVVHPVLGIDRDGDGTVTAVTPARGAPRRESVMHFEVDRPLDEAGRADLEQRLRRVLTELRLAVRDFLPMVERVERMIDAASAATARYSDEEIHESIEFLQWLTDDNFIYLGYREYTVTGDGDEAVARVVPDSGLGILADPKGSAYAKNVSWPGCGRRCGGGSRRGR